MAGAQTFPPMCGDDEPHEQHAVLDWTAEGGQNTWTCFGVRGPHVDVLADPAFQRMWKALGDDGEEYRVR